MGRPKGSKSTYTTKADLLEKQIIELLEINQKVVEKIEQIDYSIDALQIAIKTLGEDIEKIKAGGKDVGNSA